MMLHSCRMCAHVFNFCFMLHNVPTHVSQFHWTDVVVRACDREVPHEVFCSPQDEGIGRQIRIQVPLRSLSPRVFFVLQYGM